MSTNDKMEEGVFSCTVWPEGDYEGSMKPEAAPHMLHAIQNILISLANFFPPGEMRDGVNALNTQARSLEMLGQRLDAEGGAELTGADRETLGRFRAAITEDVAKAGRGEWAKETLLSGIVIAARHFASGESVVLRRALLEVAAEMSGVPMEVVVVGGHGHKVLAWRPARGEVGWLPYVQPTAEEWAKVTP